MSSRGGKDTKRAARARARVIIRRLERAYPEARTALDFTTPLELLVATILAAQCTDERVNQVTRSLFERYRSAQDYAAADPAALEGAIRSTGFFRAKTRSLIGMGQALVERHGGAVPRDREALLGLPGVGLKTANVLRGNAFGEPAIAVDTHVFRIAQRLGLARSDDPDRVHDQLVEVIPRNAWTRFCHLVQAHGRTLCTARRPACPRLSDPGAVPVAGQDQGRGTSRPRGSEWRTLCRGAAQATVSLTHCGSSSNVHRCAFSRGSSRNPMTQTECESKRSWFVVDAEGVVLGRLASRVATILRGKHKRTFSPHLDGGDHVVVVNAREGASHRPQGPRQALPHPLRLHREPARGHGRADAPATSRSG